MNFYFLNHVFYFLSKFYLYLHTCLPFFVYHSFLHFICYRITCILPELHAFFRNIINEYILRVNSQSLFDKNCILPMFWDIIMAGFPSSWGQLFFLSILFFFLSRILFIIQVSYTQQFFREHLQAHSSILKFRVTHTHCTVH